MLYHIECALQVHIDDSVELLLGHSQDKPVAGYACVVDQHSNLIAQLGKILADLSHGLLGLLKIRDIAFVILLIAALGQVHFAESLFTDLLIGNVDHCDACTVICEPLYYCCAYTAKSAGNDHGFVQESVHIYVLPIISAQKGPYPALPYR